jgi:hypothetical protein
MCSSLTRYFIVNSLCGKWEWRLWAVCSSTLVCTCCCVWWWVSYALCYCHIFSSIFYIVNSILLWQSYFNGFVFVLHQALYFHLSHNSYKGRCIISWTFTVVLWYVDLTCNLRIALVSYGSCISKSIFNRVWPQRLCWYVCIVSFMWCHFCLCL